MSNGTSDDKKKLIIDAEVAQAAAAGITAVLRGELSRDQVRALIGCDEYYLREVARIAPALAPGHAPEEA